MKIRVMIAVMLLWTNFVFGKQDSLSFEKRMSVLETRLRTTNDSLRRELLYYGAKDDYYSAALSDQSTRFATIIGAIIGIAALLGFGWYAKLIKEIKEGKQYIDLKVNKLNEEFGVVINMAVEKIEDLEKDRLYNNSMIYASISNSLTLNYSDELDKLTKIVNDRVIKTTFGIFYMLMSLDNEISFINLEPKRKLISALTFIEDITVKIDYLCTYLLKNKDDLTALFTRMGLDEDIILRIIKKNKNEELEIHLYKLQMKFEYLLKDRTKT